jgi:hypothetical protein
MYLLAFLAYFRDLIPSLYSGEIDYFVLFFRPFLTSSIITSAPSNPAEILYKLS